MLRTRQGCETAVNIVAREKGGAGENLWLRFGNHGQLGNLKMKVTWENNQMGNFPLPCLTSGGYILMKPSFHLLVCSLNRMVLNLHPFLAEVVECQRLTPREFVRQNEQILFRMLALFCRCTVQNCSFFFCSIGRSSQKDRKSVV